MHQTGKREQTSSTETPVSQHLQASPTCDALVRDEGVAGSNPATPTKFPAKYDRSPDSFPDSFGACGTAPVRIQRQRTKGWLVPENTVYVGRPGPWGNPFNFSSSDNCWNALALGCRGDRAGRREAAVKAFRQWIDDPRGRVAEMDFGVVMEGRGKKIPLGPRATAGAAPSRDDIQKALRGKNLMCWCRLCDRHRAKGKPFGEACPDCAPCHSDPLGEIANAPHPSAARRAG